ncbi:MAG: class I SAM-dependent methyltransferase [Bdellovibrionaceae bacterium]|nr:class I SAM-dependent methyltransferase [Pseudobdellovibrionaceae bacterium]
MSRSSEIREEFRPVQHIAVKTRMQALIYHLRRTVDLQFNTVYRDMAKTLHHVRGQVLDVGCRNGPFKHLLGPETRYTGLDIESTSVFGRRNPDVIYYDGRTMPFADASYDFVICSEVLEHVPDTETFIAEIFRVLKPGGRAIFTVPWSARYHFIPHDYYRFTPSAFERIFANFSDLSVRARGTEISAIAAKFVALNARLILQGLRPTRWLTGLVPGLLLLPVTALALLFGQLGIYFRVGSDVDPLGYTIELTK